MSKKKSAPQQDTTAYKNYLNYLNKYDTSNVDNTLGNLTNWASTSSADNLIIWETILLMLTARMRQGCAKKTQFIPR